MSDNMTTNYVRHLVQQGKWTELATHIERLQFRVTTLECKEYENGKETSYIEQRHTMLERYCQRLIVIGDKMREMVGDHHWTLVWDYERKFMAPPSDDNKLKPNL